MWIHNFLIDLDWNLLALISRVDSFKKQWEGMERSHGPSLKQLKSIATVSSVGASTRIEGSRLSDKEVDIILSALHLEKLEDRDTQEVAGYYETLELILDSYGEIPVSENAIRDLHNRMLRHSQKDEWHRGGYKQHPNHVEASLPDGSKHIIFQTSPPGFATDDAMTSLMEWYHADQKTHPLVKVSTFVYELLSIHPFQDGNGRLSRLMTTLLLLKEGYQWIQYISFEHEIENRKAEYYKTLRACQSQRPDEDITLWVQFFLDCMVHLQTLLEHKLESTGIESELTQKEKSILTLIRERPGIQSGEMASRLQIPLPTVKRLLAGLVQKELILKKGVGRGTWYE